MNQIVTANKVTTWNSVTGMQEVEVCDNDRLAQLKSMPFIRIEKIEQVEHNADYVCVVGGITPAFKRVWESL